MSHIFIFDTFYTVTQSQRVVGGSGDGSEVLN